MTAVEKATDPLKTLFEISSLVEKAGFSTMQRACNETFVGLTLVWMADETGSESYYWPRKVNDPGEDVRVEVPRPPDIRVTHVSGKEAVNEEDVAQYKEWAVKYLPAHVVDSRDFSAVQSGQQVGDWWLAKRVAYKNETGYFPEFTPPFPSVGGGRTPAAIG